jgi:hypothetical protein
MNRRLNYERMMRYLMTAISRNSECSQESSELLLENSHIVNNNHCLKICETCLSVVCHLTTAAINN